MKGELNGQKTYSVYFGQTFEEKSSQEETTSAPIASKVRQDVYNIASISDLDSVPDAFEIGDLVNSFNAHFHDGVSNVSIHKIVNLVFIIRKVITRRNAGDYPNKITDLL